MKKISLLFLLIFSTLFSSEIGIVYGLDPHGDGFLSLRKKPKSTEIGRLYNGDKVEILGKSGKWYKVKDLRYNRIGWSHSNWIRIDYYASRNHTSTKSKSREVVSYYAKLSDKDHFNTRTGKKITDVAYIIQQDRANYHKYHKRDSEDTGDSFFDTIENRKKIKGMLTRGNISWQLKNEILNDTPYVKVTVRGNRMDIEHIAPVSHKKDTTTTDNYKKDADTENRQQSLYSSESEYSKDGKTGKNDMPSVTKENAFTPEDTDERLVNKTDAVADQINSFLPYILLIGIPLGLLGFIRMNSSKKECPYCGSNIGAIKVGKATYLCEKCNYRWTEDSTKT